MSTSPAKKSKSDSQEHSTSTGEGKSPARFHLDGSSFYFYASLHKSLRKILRVVKSQNQNFPRKSNLTAAELVCLIILKKHGPTISLNALAERAYLHVKTVADLVTKLEDKKIIRQKAKGSRPVQVKISLAAKGKKLAEAIPYIVSKTLFDSLKKMPALDEPTPASSMEDLADALELKMKKSQFLLRRKKKKKKKAK